MGYSKWAAGMLLCLISAATCGAQNAPADGWKIATPEEVGINSGPLAEMFEFIAARQIPMHSVQIARHGRLALDAYIYPFKLGLRHDVASVTKSVTSTLIGLAIDKGYLRGEREPIADVLGHRALKNVDARKTAITLEHLLTMQAGWDCGFEPNEARLFEMRRSGDWLQFMFDLPMVAEAGTRWAYCSGNCHLLSAVITKATGKSALNFARRELFEPMGIHDVAWTKDSSGNEHGWGDLQMHPRDMAKIGQLFLQRGRWNDRQLISEAWALKATRAHVERTSNADQYGYYWWVKGTNFPGMFEAVGRGGQRINVWPAKHLVLVFTGGAFEPGEVAPFILKALKSDQPLPPNAEAARRLQTQLKSIGNAPTARQAPKKPPVAAQISGKTFRTGANSMELSAIRIDFEGEAQAMAKLTWSNRTVAFGIGLDGVERFSDNPLTGLPQAAKGEWLDGATFLLDLNLVGAINRYQLRLSFAEDGARLEAALSERTGLAREKFSGVAAP